ncbi:unnamed protein product [Linum tenue]|uniref:Uncharacterized protein n=1 Tax=Linum tenue TaxID=586396 RepID=A0AAV0R8R6_9ROSI|nr:unnamed protein product [Linum tenue]
MATHEFQRRNSISQLPRSAITCSFDLVLYLSINRAVQSQKVVSSEDARNWKAMRRGHLFISRNSEMVRKILQFPCDNRMLKLLPVLWTPDAMPLRLQH